MPDDLKRQLLDAADAFERTNLVLSQADNSVSAPTLRNANQEHAKLLRSAADRLEKAEALTKDLLEQIEETIPIAYDNGGDGPVYKVLAKRLRAILQALAPTATPATGDGDA